MGGTDSDGTATRNVAPPADSQSAGRAEARPARLITCSERRCRARCRRDCRSCWASCRHCPCRRHHRTCRPIRHPCRRRQNHRRCCYPLHQLQRPYRTPSRPSARRRQSRDWTETSPRSFAITQRHGIAGLAMYPHEHTCRMEARPNPRAVQTRQPPRTAPTGRRPARP
jgi:hypothetical protein